MIILPKILNLNPETKLFNVMLETYLVHDIWFGIKVIPIWANKNTNDPPLGARVLASSKYCSSETEKAEQCLAFMHHLCENYNEDVICFEFPRNYPVLNRHSRMHFTTVGSLSTYAITGQKPTICIVYDVDSFREKDTVERAFLISSHRPTIVYYLD